MGIKTLLKTKFPSLLICMTIVILLSEPALSNAVEANTGSRAIPYEEEDREHIPSAAARISDVRCSRASGWYYYEFAVEVFPTCWDSIYSIDFVEIEDVSLHPVAWPSGWSATGEPENLMTPEVVSFYTQTNPMLPGTRLSGFAVTSPTNRLTFRWYPKDASGVLIGKITKQEFTCPTDLEPQSWGTIKAMYR
jgi:hypothetical protein